MSFVECLRNQSGNGSRSGSGSGVKGVERERGWTGYGSDDGTYEVLSFARTRPLESGMTATRHRSSRDQSRTRLCAASRGCLLQEYP
jgi:hypothetical protein